MTTGFKMPASTYKPCRATNIVDAPNRDCGWSPTTCYLHAGHDGKHKSAGFEWEEGGQPVRTERAR